ncbi:MAG: TIGR03545 family protein [Bdellovibrionales bacterium]|nr:TIGR03545 family protein [Bdellovibrionales bacterium]
MAKKNKKKGPLRLEAIIPITIILLLIIGYFTYFFDGHLRRGIEYGATFAHGAEVNVGALHTSFTEPSLTISKIQVTDKSDPTLNIIEIGTIKLKLLWDALLRAKFVIPESSVLGIQLKSPRKHPGRILPPKPPSKDKGMVAKSLDKTVEDLKKKNDANVLSDLLAVAGGTDYKEQLKKMESELKSVVRVKELEKELKTKEQEWKKKIDALPDESEVKQLVKKVETFKLDTSNPKKIQESIKQLDGIYKEARDKYKTVDAAKKAFEQDFKTYKAEYQNLEKQVQNDIQGITQKLNIPSLDPQELSAMLLGNMVAGQLQSVEKYKNLAREYMPTKKAKDTTAEELTPHERAKGLNFKFLTKKSYPRFWLKKASISSKSKEGEAGDLMGTLENVTDAPKHLGLPATLHFEGGFPKQNVLDVVGDIVVDHTTDEPKETAKIAVGHFPVQKNHLSKSGDVEFGYNKADGSSNIGVIIKDQSISMQANSLFDNVDYFVKAKSPQLQDILNSITQDLKQLTLNVRAKGSWDDLSLHINSNLGQKLQQAIKAQIEAQIKKARKQVEDHVKGLVDKEKAKVQGEINKIEQQFGVSLKSREDAVNSIKDKVEAKKNEAINSEKKKVEKKIEKDLKKEAEKLLKGVKLKF